MRISYADPDGGEPAESPENASFLRLCWCCHQQADVKWISYADPNGGSLQKVLKMLAFFAFVHVVTLAFVGVVTNKLM